MLILYELLRLFSWRSCTKIIPYKGVNVHHFDANSLILCQTGKTTVGHAWVI